MWVCVRSEAAVVSFKAHFMVVEKVFERKAEKCFLCTRQHTKRVCGWWKGACDDYIARALAVIIHIIERAKPVAVKEQQTRMCLHGELSAIAQRTAYAVVFDKP